MVPEYRGAILNTLEVLRYGRLWSHLKHIRWHLAPMCYGALSNTLYGTLGNCGTTDIHWVPGNYDKWGYEAI